MKEKSENAIREALAEFLGFLEYKVRNGVLTIEDTKAVLSALEAGGGLKATVRDLAGYFHQSEDNVRHIVHRNYFPAPERRVYYDFGTFARVVPGKWHKRRK